MAGMIATAQLQGMNGDQLRALAMDLMSEVRARDSELRLKDIERSSARKLRCCCR